MIRYEAGRWSLAFIFALQGSVFPRALAWAVPSAVAAIVIRLAYDRGYTPSPVVSQAWFAIASVLGFLIVFRTQQGYSRYWEGASLMQSVRAYWLNAASNLIAFCSKAPERELETCRFQHQLVRLVSLMYCCALQGVAALDDRNFEVLELNGISETFMSHVSSQHGDDKCLVVLQSIQQLMISELRSGVIDVPAPIVSRVFQELSNGIVAYSSARKISGIPFPFPYAQLVTVLLMIFSCVTPWVIGILADTWIWACCMTFAGTLGFWSINYIAAEIEMPFGDDANDLPMSEFQCEMNSGLKLLLHPLSACPPSYKFDKQHMGRLPPSMTGIVEQTPLTDDIEVESQSCMRKLCNRLSRKPPKAAHIHKQWTSGISVRNSNSILKSRQAVDRQDRHDSGTSAQNISERNHPCPDARVILPSLSDLDSQTSSNCMVGERAAMSLTDSQRGTSKVDGESHNNLSGVVPDRDGDPHRSKSSNAVHENKCQHPSLQATKVESLLVEILHPP